MTAEQLLSHLTQVAFIVIWFAVLARAIQRPRLATIHAAIFFGLTAVIISVSWAAEIAGGEPHEVVTKVIVSILVSMPFVLLLLADDFAGVPRNILAGSAALMIAMIVAVVAQPVPYSGFFTLVLIVFMVTLFLYSTARFALAARDSSGVSQRRMQAVAIAGGLFALIFVFSGMSTAFPGQAGAWQSMSSIASLACVTAYFAGFAPPRFVRHAWRAPQLQTFFATSTLAPRTSLGDLTRALEEGMKSLLGAPTVSIGVWDPTLQRLEVPSYTGTAPATVDVESTPAYRSFRLQTPLFVEDAERHDPANAEAYRQYGARSIIVAPITIEDRRVGVLMVYGERAPLFAEEELEIVESLARQVALVLRDFELASELTEFRAHQEAVRLKDDFLSAAAHDLKTPLTTVMAQSQLMQRRARRDPGYVPEAEAIERLVQESQRMSRLVNDLLDAARDDQMGFVGERVAVDLHTLVSELLTGFSGGPPIVFEGTSAIVLVDADRIRQCVTNLLDNAIKYSPKGGSIEVTVNAGDGYARLHVKDDGIGISPEDIPVIFERFRRAPNVQHSSVTGLGLGLYFCKRIVEEHGGAVSVESVVGKGTDFEISLPLAEAGTVPGTRTEPATEAVR